MRSLSGLVAIALTLAIVCFHSQRCAAFTAVGTTCSVAGGRFVAVDVVGHASNSRQSISFVASRRRRRRSMTRSVSTTASVRNSQPLRATDEPAEEVDTSIPSIITDESSEVTDEKDSVKKNGLSLVPLFFKFCVVLAVKFITDVLVFPPLFAWRFFRLVYRNFMRIVLGKGSKGGGSSQAS